MLIPLFLDPKVPKALLAQLDLLALQAWQAQQVQLDQEEPLVPKERMAQPVPPDHKVSQAIQVQLVPQVHLAVMVQPVPKAHREQLVQPVPLLQSLDQPALLAPKVPLVQTVPKVLLGLKDFKV